MTSQSSKSASTKATQPARAAKSTPAAKQAEPRSVTSRSGQSPIDCAALRTELRHTARGLGLPEGSAEAYLSRVIPAVERSLAKKSLITRADLARALAREFAHYDADFAYYYQNRDIII